jgi:hypothetical protein
MQHAMHSKYGNVNTPSVLEEKQGYLRYSSMRQGQKHRLQKFSIEILSKSSAECGLNMLKQEIRTKGMKKVHLSSLRKCQ